MVDVSSPQSSQTNQLRSSFHATSSNVHDFFVTPLGNYHLENTWLGK